MTTIQVGSKLLGDGEPCFVIAEVGSNWETLEHCLYSIEVAKRCGADAVKFQLFTRHALYGIELDNRIDQAFCGRSPFLDPAWLPALKEKADACEIEFMCSAFSPELIEAVDPYVNIHKVASAEMCHVRMLGKLKAISKPVILSTGAHDEKEIDMAIAHLGATPLVLLYCVASYPARDVDVEVIPMMRHQFQKLVGFSDHSLSAIAIPRSAQAAGACVIEKHFTAYPELETPDRGHSLRPAEFKEMVEALQNRLPRVAGRPIIAERDMVLKHNRRLIATKDLEPGDLLKEGENFGIYRALKNTYGAISPFLIDRLDGAVVKNKLRAGDGIKWGDV